jgi:hypothetical protein
MALGLAPRTAMMDSRLDGGAQHGIAVHDDPQYPDPQTQSWRAGAIEDFATWLRGEQLPSAAGNERATLAG